ncbi:MULTISPECIES: HAD-IA family hydrolase [unclassified Actinotalea]|uniref:HAD-IA family hydrolase n=1 Tax=unclassified Actinotalea TaxID=2638618 RepID=UPI001C70CB58|nr:MULTISPECIES: HAD-IA family hydrolase [unclassified Actinotalea]
MSAPDPAGLLGRSFAGVLFDMDGTLISSVEAIVRAWTTMAHEYGIPPDRFGDVHGIPTRRLVDLLLAHLAEPERETAYARVLELELGDVAGITVLPGAVEALQLLAPLGLCAIVTSCTRDVAVARLAAAGLPVPAALVTVDDVVRGKPDPEPFRLGADRLGVEPAHCLVVEDATSGIAAGRAAGAATVGLLTTTPGIDADLVVPDLAALRFAVAADGRVRMGLA